MVVGRLRRCFRRCFDREEPWRQPYFGKIPSQLRFYSNCKSQEHRKKIQQVQLHSLSRRSEACLGLLQEPGQIPLWLG